MFVRNTSIHKQKQKNIPQFFGSDIPRSIFCIFLEKALQRKAFVCVQFLVFFADSISIFKNS